MWANINSLAVVFAQTDTSKFWSSSIGTFLGAILTAVGILVVLAAIVKAIGSMTKGKVGDGVKSILAGAVVAAFCFQPELIGRLIDLLAGIVSKVLESISSIGG